MEDTMVAVQLKIPREWMQDLQHPATLLQVLGLGMEEYRFQRALSLYQKGVGSIGYVAELVGVSKRVLMEEARRRGVLPHYDEHFAEQDVSR